MYIYKRTGKKIQVDKQTTKSKTKLNKQENREN